ncbi:thiamin ABC transporter [Klebsiella pneumoniae]|uniref:Thiamin ABC transporter n=1 Tax=Klebsiella pneumoniae TaxID=573 RepID=A0A2X3D4B3_KLEPN|nr:thiamin ABC transporter [Klebsiella pneumoniae]
MLKKLLPLLALVAMPALAKPVLTVYTYDSFSADWGPGPAVKKAFEAECGCELKFVALEDGVSLLNRLRMEGKNSKADVVLGLDNNLLEAAAQSKLFAKSNVPASAVSVPGGWDNDTFVPYDYGYFAFVYDKNKLANPPKSLKELVEGPQKWRVIYEDPRTSTPGLGPAAVDAKGLWRSSARGLAEAGRENRYRHQRLERSLWPVPERGKRPGVELYHLAGLPHD